MLKQILGSSLAMPPEPVQWTLFLTRPKKRHDDRPSLLRNPTELIQRLGFLGNALIQSLVTENEMCIFHSTTQIPVYGVSNMNSKEFPAFPECTISRPRGAKSHDLPR